MRVILETYLMKVILEAYLMKFILETYLMKVIQSKDWKPKSCKFLGAIKPKVINRIANDQLRSPMPEAGEH
jgi:hypothetical protein